MTVEWIFEILKILKILKILEIFCAAGDEKHET